MRIRDTLKAPRIPLMALLWLALALRLIPLINNPFHQDEALYSFWGRLISTGRDPWLATVAVDKPPLALYLIAGSQAAFGVSEFSARLPGLAASLLTIPLTYALARRLYCGQARAHLVGWVAAAVMALTPYPVLFGAAAFTDAPLIVFWLAACYAAASGRWGWAGITMGLALASKQQAVLLALLVIGVGRGAGLVPEAKLNGRGRGRTVWARFLLGLGFVGAVVWGWDALRVANGATIGFWGQGIDSYGGLRLIWPEELVLRLRGWTQLTGYFFGWPGLGWLFLGGAGLLLWRDLTRSRQTRPALIDLTLIAFTLFYLFFHLLIAFPVWDRYLLPLTPAVALLLGRAAALVPLYFAAGTRAASRPTSHALRFTFYVLLVSSLLGSGLLATGGRIPIGGDQGTYDGLQEVVVYLHDLPVGTVLYDRWLSWHYDFYLFDAYLYRAGFPSPAWLARDAATHYNGQPRYLVLPDWQSPARLRRNLAEVGMVLSPALTTRRRDGTSSFVVYRIEFSESLFGAQNTTTNGEINEFLPHVTHSFLSKFVVVSHCQYFPRKLNRAGRCR